MELDEGRSLCVITAPQHAPVAVNVHDVKGILNLALTNRLKKTTVACMECS